MRKVYLFEISDITENQIKLPYSTGLIWGHCILDNTIKSNYELGGWIYYRDEIDRILSKVENPSVVGFSNLSKNQGYFDFVVSKQNFRPWDTKMKENSQI